MKRLFFLIVVAGLCLSASRAYAQDGLVLGGRLAEPASVATLFLEGPSASAYRKAAEACTTPRGCVVLGSTLTTAGVVMSGLGVAFLTRLDSENSDDDIVLIPVAFLGGTLLLSGLISTGIGIHLIAKSRRIKRMNFDMGWQGAPAARLRLRF